MDMFDFFTHFIFNKNTNYSRVVSIGDEHRSSKCKTDILEVFSICNGKKEGTKKFQIMKRFLANYT